MEANVKRREWVKTAAIIFLVVLLVLTFFSNTIMNRSLPEVATQSVQSGSINARIRGSGTVAANETYDVTISQTRKIASVLVKVGQTVEAGDKLFLLDSMESSDLTTARTELDSMELAYEKSLIEASNGNAKEDRTIQKLRETYNDLLAQYNQYSTMDVKAVELEKTKAEAALKESQKELEKAQKELTKIQSDKDYTQAKSDVDKYTSDIETQKTKIAELEEQYNALESGQSVAEQIQALQEAINTLNGRISEKQTEVNQLMDNKDYAALSTLSGDKDSYMRIYVSDRAALERKIMEIWPMTADDAAAQASAMITAYNAVVVAQNELTQLQNECSSKQARLEKLQTQQDNYTTKEELWAEIIQERNNLDALNTQLRAAEWRVQQFETNIENIENAIERLQDQVDNQQDTLDKLTNASSLAGQVKTAKEQLDDQLFEQALADGSNLDLQAAKEAIEKKKEEIKKLEADAEGGEVTAKVSGVIGAINVTAGNTIGPEQALATIQVVDRGYTIKISVTADQAKKVRVGDKADLVNYWGGDIDATLENIANDPSNPGKGKLLVFRLSGEVEPDTNLTLSIGQKSANYDCLVPNSAVRSDSNGSFVLAVVVKSSPLGNRYTATRVDVKVLASDDTMSAVSGLSQGDFVITTSTKPIEAGTLVRLAENG